MHFRKCRSGASAVDMIKPATFNTTHPGNSFVLEHNVWRIIFHMNFVKKMELITVKLINEGQFLTNGAKVSIVPSVPLQCQVIIWVKCICIWFHSVQAGSLLHVGHSEREEHNVMQFTTMNVFFEPQTPTSRLEPWSFLPNVSVLFGVRMCPFIDWHVNMWTITHKLLGAAGSGGFHAPIGVRQGVLEGLTFPRGHCSLAARLGGFHAAKGFAAAAFGGLERT